MEQRLANTWRMAANEKKFIEKALMSDLRVDGRGPFDYRKLNIKFGREDGSSEVQLGQTHVMGFVTSQLAQPYRDRPNEGSLSVFTEFSPMADPSFEPGRPGESAVELGRIIDRGLRESKAVDTESLCVLAGKLVWAIRIDIHILDNGGNLVDAANIAALAALMTFRRPECTLGGENGQEVIVHPPEEREPLPLIIHHLPIAVTFAFFRNESTMAIDPTHFEEAVMSGRMTATLNTNGDICAIQKAGGEGVLQSVIMQCLRIASVKAADITTTIKKAVEAYSVERQLRKVKRHNSSVAVDVVNVGASHNQSISQKVIGELSGQDLEIQSPDQGEKTTRGSDIKNFTGGSSSWDSSSKSVDPDLPKASIASCGTLTSDSSQKDVRSENKKKQSEAKTEELGEDAKSTSSAIDACGTGEENNGENTLKNAIKPKSRRKKK